jgi:hypothetical protein
MRGKPVEDVSLVTMYFAEIKITELWGSRMLEGVGDIGGQLVKECRTGD